MKKLLIATIVLVLLGGGLWFLNTDKFSPDEESKTRAFILSRLDTQELSSIYIKGKEGKVELFNEQEGIWKVKRLNYEADVQKIKTLLLKLMEMKLGYVVTNNPDQYTRFELMVQLPFHYGEKTTPHCWI